jgi:hypothetical protein
MQRKGSYFYVIDAFIASVIVITALVVIFSTFFAQPSSTQVYYTGEDLLTSMESTSSRDYDSTVVRAWIANGTITDPKRTLLQQLALFEATGNAGNTTGVLSGMIAASTPTNIDIEILVNGRQCYIRQSRLQANADTLLSAKRVVLLRQSPTELYNPIIVEARTWQ